MTLKYFLLLVLLASHSVFCQTLLPEVEDNRSQVPLPIENDAKAANVVINNENTKVEIETGTQKNDIHKLTEIERLTKLPIPEKDSDVTSEPEVPDKPESKQQVPIFMDQHMMGIIDKQLNQQDKHESNSASVTDNTVKSKSNEQVPIFMDQYLFNVVDKQMNAQDKNIDVEGTTEVSEVKTDKPYVLDNHRVPMFMDQQMVKGIMDAQKNLERLMHKDVTTFHPNIHIPEPKDHYKNSMYLEGHHRSTLWHNRFTSVLSSVMNNEMSFGENSVSVYPLETTYEYTSTGHKLTRVEFVVTYDGRVLAEYEVTNTLSRPRPSQSLKEGLNHIHTRQYTMRPGQTATDSTTQSKMKAYVKPVVIVLVTLAVVAILLVLVVVIYVKRNRVEPPKPKDKKELMRYILEADKRAMAAVEPIKPPPYSENSAYEV